MSSRSQSRNQISCSSFVLFSYFNVTLVTKLTRRQDFYAIYYYYPGQLSLAIPLWVDKHVALVIAIAKEEMASSA